MVATGGFQVTTAKASPGVGVFSDGAAAMSAKVIGRVVPTPSPAEL